MSEHILTKDAREAKLPVWAKQRLSDLRGAIEARDRQIAELEQVVNAGAGIGAPNSDTVAGIDPPLPLPAGTPVDFTASDGGTVMVEVRDGRVVASTAIGVLAVVPTNAAFEVQLRPEKNGRNP